MLRSKVSRWTAAGGLGLAVLVAGAGLARSAGDDKPAAKDEKKPAFDPKDVRVGPPPELAALREAVEDAAKKGENVEEIRKQLDALEKALAGKAWVKPKPAAEPPAPAQPQPNFRGRVQPPAMQPFALPAPPALGGLGGLDDAVRQRGELLRKAAELLAQDPQSQEAAKLLKEAQELMLRGALQPDIAFGGRMLAVPDVVRGGALNRLSDARLGVRIEKAPAALADQLDLPAGRGLVVTEVRPGSPADKAGIKPHDVILEFAGQPVTDNAAEFVRMVETARKGAKVDATVLRKGKKEAIKGVDLPENNRRIPLPPDPGPEVPGIQRVQPRPAEIVPPVVLRPLQPLDISNSVTVRVTNGAYTLDADRGGVKYQIEGAVGGKAEPSKIKITDGGKTVEADSLEKVPAEYRKQVDQLLGSVRVGR